MLQHLVDGSQIGLNIDLIIVQSSRVCVTRSRMDASLIDTYSMDGSPDKKATATPQTGFTSPDSYVLLNWPCSVQENLWEKKTMLDYKADNRTYGPIHHSYSDSQKKKKNQPKPRKPA